MKPGSCCPVIVGPTAVGKTDLVTSLARRFPLEVISLDSRQVYKGLRIGTAQPTSEEQAACPHHLVDFLSPLEKYDAMRFRQDFESLFQDIVNRGGVPLLVGGAGMYLTALRQGFMDLPLNHEESLAAVRSELEALDDATIRKRLKAIDPVSFGTIHANDRYRSQRALEIHRITGRTMSELKAEQKPDPSLGLTFPTFVLERKVAELDQRIARRTQLMLDQGWLAETKDALERYPANCPGLRTIGYREIVDFLGGRLGREELVSAIVLVTRQYAKRQRTWFRNIPAENRGLPGDPVLLESLSRFLAQD